MVRYLCKQQKGIVMIDLHIHSNYSGGKNNLIKILQIAEKRNVSIISITDNNTCEAYAELKELSEERFYSGKIIPGCEFSTIVNNVPIELIGYNIDTDLVQDKISKLYLPKKDYNIYETNLIIEKCIEKGLVINVHNIIYDAEKERGKRAVFDEIKRHLENKRFISAEAWDNARTFLLTYTSNPNSDFFVDFSGLIPSYKQIVQLIKQCGGKVFMPHIFKYNENSMDVLETLISESMLDGIEGYYPYYSNEQHRFALEFAQKNNLYISGGSDSHGTPDSEIGIGRSNLNIPEEIITPWLDKAKIITQGGLNYEER